MLSIMIGILPGLFFTILFYLLDKNKKNINILFLIASFILGAISSYLCYRLEWHFGSYFKKVAVSNLFEVFIYALFGVAIFEEGLKLFFSYLFIKLNKVKEKTNVLTYCVVTSCGFLAFENAVFYSNKGLTTSISRLFTSSPGHVCYAIVMGILLYKVIKINKISVKSILLMGITFMVPSILHAIYNTFLYQGITSLYLYSCLFLVVLVCICGYFILGIYKFKR